MFHKNTVTLIATLVAFIPVRAARADEPLPVLPYVADDVAAVAYVDLTKIDVPAVLARFSAIAGLPAEQLKLAEPVAAVIQGSVQHFRQLGVGRVYVLLGVRDVAHGGPAWVVPLAAGADANQVVESLKRIIPPSAAQGDLVVPRYFAVVDGTILAASSAEQLTALESGRRTGENVRAEAREAMAPFTSHAAAVVLFADTDSRRVVREMFPRLPVPFDEIDGPFLADDVRWVGLALDVAPDLRVQATLQMSGTAEANTAEAVIVKGLELAKQFLLAQEDIPEEVRGGLAEAFALLRPATADAAVSITLGGNPEELAALGKLLAQPVQAARTAAGTTQRMNQFKQLALAFHVYHDKNKSFPPAAICDKDGKPLLSWRVALLPYLEQNDLYKEFHLDEPWDSEHNRKLIERMPAFYADPDPAVRKAIGDPYKTTYVVPTGEGTVFHGCQGMGVKEITDGTSCTILAVEVVPERAVIWTKPDDWEVDWKNPLDGVRRSDGRPFAAVWCDGSVRIQGADIDPGWWKKVLTPAGGEVVE